jgi:hypothetical protein
MPTIRTHTGGNGQRFLTRTDHTHINTLARRETQFPVSSQINISLSSRILNHKLSSLDLFCASPVLPEVHFQNSYQSLIVLAKLLHEMSILTSAERMNSRRKGLNLPKASNR